MSVALIWAQSRSGIIGDAGTIPWHVPEDVAHFKELTLGGTVVMGRRTWDSLPERFRPLSGRENVVVTRDERWSAEGARAAHSLHAVLEHPVAAGTLWVMGGGEIYAAAMPFADRLEVTEIDLDVPGDTRAPAIDSGLWRLGGQSDWLPSRSGIRYRFLRYGRG